MRYTEYHSGKAVRFITNRNVSIKTRIQVYE